MNRNDKEFIVQKIRAEYTEKEFTSLDKLKNLDKKVKRPVNIFSYIFGSVGAIIMGSGMSLIMTDIGEKLNIADTMTIGVIIGIIGMLIVIINYPIYKKLLAGRKDKYAKEIMEISDKIIKEN